MQFQLDQNDVFEGGKIEDGTYEVLVVKCYEDASQSGSENTTFDLVIRNDIEQKSKNMRIWNRVWKSKKDNKYNMKMFNTIGKACQLQNGKTYNSFEELLNDFVGKPVQVYVKNETSEYNGNTYENLNVKSWSETKFSNVQHQFKDQGDAPANSGPADISDSDLPF